MCPWEFALEMDGSKRTDKEFVNALGKRIKGITTPDKIPKKLRESEEEQP